MGRLRLSLALLPVLLLAACQPQAAAAPVAPPPVDAPAAATPAFLPTYTPGAQETPAAETPSAPAPTPPADPCAASQGRVEAGALEYPDLEQPLEFAVYLPPCYAHNPAQRYPVLYLVHGQSYSHDQWQRLGVDQTAWALTASGELPPFILILPHDRSWAQPSADAFGRALVEVLIPHVDATYFTRPERAYRAIGGLSRGAAWAVHLGVSQWQLFGAIGAHSLPVFWEDTPRLRRWLQAIPAGALPRISLDIGEQDRPETLESAHWFEAMLTEEDIPHRWQLFPGFHDEAYWQAHLEGYLRWYAEPWEGAP
ncbi:MAG: hypothetical protein L0Z70_00230 [Chloroflexi bacterium]|nr:hypothetical protein [Chloroflexota bacterium]